MLKDIYMNWVGKYNFYMNFVIVLVAYQFYRQILMYCINNTCT